MIHVRALEKSYLTGSEPLPVLRGIDLDIGAGESVAIVGASGSGKSTLLNVLGLLDDFDGGTYTLAGHDARGLTDARAATMRNQAARLRVPELSSAGRQKCHRKRRTAPHLPQHLPVGNDTSGQSMLERVGLGDRLDHRPNQLSAWSEATGRDCPCPRDRAGVLFADEPTGALDSTTSDEVLSLLEEVVAEGKTLVLVTHDPDVARRMQRTIQLHDGLIVSDRKGADRARLGLHRRLDRGGGRTARTPLRTGLTAFSVAWGSSC